MHSLRGTVRILWSGYCEQLRLAMNPWNAFIYAVVIAALHEADMTVFWKMFIAIAYIIVIPLSFLYINQDHPGDY